MVTGFYSLQFCHCLKKILKRIIGERRVMQTFPSYKKRPVKCGQECQFEALDSNWTSCENLLLKDNGWRRRYVLPASTSFSLSLPLSHILDCSCLVSRRIQMEFHMKLAGTAVAGRTDDGVSWWGLHARARIFVFEVGRNYPKISHELSRHWRPLFS